MRTTQSIKNYTKWQELRLIIMFCLHIPIGGDVGREGHRGSGDGRGEEKFCFSSLLSFPMSLIPLPSLLLLPLFPLPSFFPCPSFPRSSLLLIFLPPLPSFSPPPFPFSPSTGPLLIPFSPPLHHYVFQVGGNTKYPSLFCRLDIQSSFYIWSRLPQVYRTAIRPSL